MCAACAEASLTFQHRALGLGPIHWYARDRRFVSWIDTWLQTDDAAADTFRFAPPLDPETFGTSKLAVQGLYQDQVLYALDAILRSTYLGPSRWLAFLDVDEFALPDPVRDWHAPELTPQMPRTRSDRRKAIIRFLDGFGAEVPSISLGRTHSATNSHLGHLVDHRPGEITPAPRLSELGLIRSPQRSDWPGNVRSVWPRALLLLGRLDGLELALLTRIDLMPPAQALPPR